MVYSRGTLVYHIYYIIISIINYNYYEYFDLCSIILTLMNLYECGQLINNYTKLQPAVINIILVYR